MRTRVTASLLCLLLATALALAAGAASRPALAQVPASFTPLPTFTAVPTITLLPSPTQPACPTPLALTSGTLVALIPGVNLRNLPTLSGAVTNYYTNETVLTLAGGPVCANGYNWWYVTGAGNPGWVIEGYRGRIVLRAVNATPDPSTICLRAAPLIVNAQARVLNGVLLHEAADNDSRVLHDVLSDEVLDVLAGPVCADNLNWWQVRAPYARPGQPNGSITGWVSDGYPDGFWLEALVNGGTPTPNYCSRPLRLNVGSRAAVVYGDRIPRTLRAAPTTSGAVIEELIGGVAFDITGSPVCADGFNWWPIRLLSTGTTGWLAEGRPGNYWFDFIIEATNPASVEPTRTPIPTPTGFGI